MEGTIKLEDLQRVVRDLLSDRLSSSIMEGDKTSIGRVVGGIALTLDEMGVQVTPNTHMLRVNEARAMIGYLKAKYKGRARRLTTERERFEAIASINAKSDLISSGEKATAAAVADLARIDENYQKALAEENAALELLDILSELSRSIDQRHDVMLEISRNIRKEKDDG